MFSKSYNLHKALPRKIHSTQFPPFKCQRPRRLASNLGQLSLPWARNISSQAEVPKTLLDYLRTRSSVDCDTLDVSVASELGPFVDCTSNQAIAYFELCKSENESILQEAAEKTSLRIKQFGNTDLYSRHAETLGAEIAVCVSRSHRRLFLLGYYSNTRDKTILLALRMTSHISSTIHLQVNPFYSFSEKYVVRGALRLVRLALWLGHDLSNDRICIKVPSTWAGLMACRSLEKRSIKTLATTLFSMEQVELAGVARCSYIAPYVNELRVHFDNS